MTNRITKSIRRYVVEFQLFISCILLLVSLIINGCSAVLENSGEFSSESVKDATLLHKSQQNLTSIIVHDIFSPPVASRIYAYANVAAYQALLAQYPGYLSLESQLNGLQDLPTPEEGKDYNFYVASIRAFNKVGRTMIFSEDKMEAFEAFLFKKMQSAIPAAVYNNSIEFGDKMADAILAWADKDGYKQTRGLKYSLLEGSEFWKPTPPAYMDAIEPYWNKIRPFVLDSASQFAPGIPFDFSLEKESDFYKSVMEVYEIGKSLTEEQKEIASFWDCNPYVMNTVGHVMYATKKITPGGHWMGITYIANLKAKADMMKSAEAYTLVAIALADGFISCWDEKYRRSVIRPETVINTYIDDNWMPLLQTPPFPEYPSGHSVVSTAASKVLTSLYGDNFSYVDSTEVEYGLPPRHFTSFSEAAQEAAISRLYGGIHFRPAITNGILEGAYVGDFVVQKLKTRKEVAEHAASSLD